jgi:nucleoside 2-deoxyribosyltransferase
MMDVFNYGIQQPIRAAGYVCERIDQANFVGDIFAEIKKRIDHARLVVADLTGARPNVYLEVGYAMGRGVPTILLTRDVVQLEFDLRGQRCLVYKNITELEKLLAQELDQLRRSGYLA